MHHSPVCPEEKEKESCWFLTMGLWLSVVLIAAFAAIVIGCGEDNPVDSKSENPTWPGLPEIPGLDYEAPASTDGVITGVSSLEHFEPKVDSGLLFCKIQYDQTCNRNGLDTTLHLFRIRLVPGYYTLVDSGQIVRQPELALQLGLDYGGGFLAMRKEWHPPRFRYVGSFGGHYYYLTDREITGPQFQFVNEANILWAGGQTMTIETAEENAFVADVIQREIPGVNIWLHLTDRYSKGEFKWFKGDVAAYTNWLTGEPNGGANAMLINGGDPSGIGKWAYVDGSGIYYAMMEAPDSLALDSDPALVYRRTTNPQHYYYPSRFVAIQNIPSIRRVRYYRKLGEGKVPVGSFVEQGYSMTSGVDTTIAVSTARTITGMVGGAFKDIQAELSMSLTRTFSSSITVSRDSTKSVTIRVNGVEGKQRVFVIWQQCERYEIVDAEGNFWTDANFAVNPITLDQGLDGYVVQTRDF